MIQMTMLWDAGLMMPTAQFAINIQTFIFKRWCFLKPNFSTWKKNFKLEGQMLELVKKKNDKMFRKIMFLDLFHILTF